MKYRARLDPSSDPRGEDKVCSFLCILFFAQRGSTDEIEVQRMLNLVVHLNLSLLFDISNIRKTKTYGY